METQPTLPSDTAIVVPESIFAQFEIQAKQKLAELSFLANATSEPTDAELEVITVGRKDCKKLRCMIENKRIEAGEEFLRRKKAIDLTAKLCIQPVRQLEEKLEIRENYKARKEQARKDALKESRELELTKYVNDSASLTLYGNLGEMPDEGWQALLLDVKASYEAKVAARVKELEEQKAKEEAQRIENERIRAENEKLRQEREEAAAKAKEAAEKKAVLQKERKAIVQPYIDTPWLYDLAALTEQEFQTFLENAMSKKAKADADVAKAKAEREAFLKAEAEAKALRDAEANRLREEAMRHADDLRAAKKAARAPDKRKLLDYADAMNSVQPPSMTTEEGKKALRWLTDSWTALFDDVATKAEEL